MALKTNVNPAKGRNRAYMIIVRSLVMIAILLMGLCCVMPAQAQTASPVDHSEIIKLVSQSRGKVVVLNFWASWCPPCREEIPEMIALRKQFPENKVTFLGVSMDQDPAAYARFTAKAGFNYPVFLAQAGVGPAFNIRGIPRTLVYGPQGEQVLTHEGYLSGEDLEKVLIKLVGS